MGTAALKARAAPVIRRATAPVCPAEACLREWAAETKRWKAYKKANGEQMPLGPTGACQPTDAIKAHWDAVHDIEQRATETLAISPVGAAYQALLLHSGGPIGGDNEPKGLTEEQKDPFLTHDYKVARVGLSLYRVLARGIVDRDLAQRFRAISAGDTPDEVYTLAGFSLMELIP